LKYLNHSFSGISSDGELELGLSIWLSFSRRCMGKRNNCSYFQKWWKM
jgi:hypothetical protein